MNSTSLLQVLGVLVNLCDCMVIWGLALIPLRTRETSSNEPISLRPR
jgi:hypothetical protein